MNMERPDVEMYKGGTGTHLGELEVLKEKLDKIEVEIIAAEGEQKQKLEKQKEQISLELETKRKEAFN